MINVYSQNETSFNNNGLATLIPTSCEFNPQINGSWQLTMEHPINDMRYLYLQKDAILRVTGLDCVREFDTSEQLFRIYDTKKTLTSITVIAFSLAIEATFDAPIEYLYTGSKTGTQAAQMIDNYIKTNDSNNKYTISSNIPGTTWSEWANTNLIAAISGSDDYSFVNRWGGEVVYDNYKIKLLNIIGEQDSDKVFPVRYGRNLTGLTYEVDTSSVITRIYPLSSDGLRLNSWADVTDQGGTSYVDTPKTLNYPFSRAVFYSVAYSLIDTTTDSKTYTADCTETWRTAITNAMHNTAATLWTIALQDLSNTHNPEYIQDLISGDDGISAYLQRMFVFTHKGWQSFVKSCAKNAVMWVKDQALPEWTWHENTAVIPHAWWYGDSSFTDSYAKNEYVKIGNAWEWFNDDGYWEAFKTVSKMQWYKSQTENKWWYGDRERYYAHDEFVYIKKNDIWYEWYYDEEGWYVEDSSGESEYDWHGEGTSADPIWFGKVKEEDEDPDPGYDYEDNPSTEKLCKQVKRFLNTDDDDSSIYTKTSLINNIKTQCNRRVEEEEEEESEPDVIDNIKTICDTYLSSGTKADFKDAVQDELDTTSYDYSNLGTITFDGTCEDMADVMEDTTSYTLEGLQNKLNGIIKDGPIHTSSDCIGLIETAVNSDEYTKLELDSVVRGYLEDAGYYDGGDDDDNRDEYIKSRWAFIDGTYYYFDEYGYTDMDPAHSMPNYAWGEQKSSEGKYWFGNENKLFAAVWLASQWAEIDGEWYYFDQDGYMVDPDQKRASIVSSWATTIYNDNIDTIKAKLTEAYGVLYTQMTQWCNDKFSSGIDLPVVNVSVDLIDLSRTVEYEDYSQLEKITLGDKVKVIGKDGEVYEERVVGLTYDCIRGYNTKVEIGQLSKSVGQVLSTSLKGSTTETKLIAGDNVVLDGNVLSVGDYVGRTVGLQDIIVNGESLGRGTVAYLNLIAGQNITIEQDGEDITINGEAGGGGSGGLKYWIETNNSIYRRAFASNDGHLDAGMSLGDVPTDHENNKLMFWGGWRQYGGLNILDGLFINYTSDVISHSWRCEKFNQFSIDNTIKNSSGSQGTVYYTAQYGLQQLIVGNTYTVKLTHQFTDGIFDSGFTCSVYMRTNGGGTFSDKYTLPKDNDPHVISFTFTARNGTNYLAFDYSGCAANKEVEASVTDCIVTGTFNSIVEDYPYRVYSDGVVYGEDYHYKLHLGGDNYSYISVRDNIEAIKDVLSNLRTTSFTPNTAMNSDTLQGVSLGTLTIGEDSYDIWSTTKGVWDYACNGETGVVTRLTSPDVNTGNRMVHFCATSSMTTNKPPRDSVILHLPWDNDGAGNGAQLAMARGADPQLYIRGELSDATWSNWFMVPRYNHNANSGLPTSNRVVCTHTNGALKTSSTTYTEIGYLSGVRSSVQQQIDDKLDDEDIEVTPYQNRGSHVADIKVGDNTYPIYTPLGGGTGYTRTQLFSGGTVAGGIGTLSLAYPVTDYDLLEFICIDVSGTYKTSFYYDATYFKNTFPYVPNITDQSMHAVLCSFSNRFCRVAMGDTDSKLEEFQISNNAIAEVYGINIDVNTSGGGGGGSDPAFVRTQLFTGGSWSTPTLTMTLNDNILNYDEIEFIVYDKNSWFRNSHKFNAKQFHDTFTYIANPVAGDNSHPNCLLCPFSTEYLRMLMGDADNKIQVYQAVNCYIGEIYGIRYMSGAGSQNIVGTATPISSIGNNGDSYYQKTNGKTYKYLRFEITEHKGNNAYTQLSELKFVDDNGIAYNFLHSNIYANITNYNATQTNMCLIDGTTETTALWRLVPSASSPITIYIDCFTPLDLSVFKKYQLWTGGDAPERDPSKWSLACSNDKVNWITLDNVTSSYSMTSDRKALGYELNISSAISSLNNPFISKQYVKDSGAWIPII